MVRPATDGFRALSIDDFPADCRGSVVAIGNFDGVHNGHQAVLGHATRIAQEFGTKAIALTFEPHPRTLFVPDKPIFRLSPRHEKRRLFEAIGLDGCIEMDFTRELASMEAGDFVKTVLQDTLAARHVVVGFDFHFGKDRAGSPAMLKASGPDHGFGVTIEEAHGDEGGSVFSSSAIRTALAEGQLEDAAHSLGYQYFVRGAVIHGEKRGRELGYPTANIALPPENVLRHGIYAVFGRIDGDLVSGVANYGRRPQFDNGAPLLEPYFFDFDADLYGKEIDVALVSFLRPEAKFDSLDALIAQMDKDSEAARNRLATIGRSAIDRALDQSAGRGE